MVHQAFKDGVADKAPKVNFIEDEDDFLAMVVVL